MPIKLAITGAAGRMGRRLIALACESESFEIIAALETPGHQLLSRDAGVLAGTGDIGVSLAEKLTTSPDVMIDFSLPPSSVAWSAYCAEHQLPLVVGTTGLTDDQLRQLQTAAHQTPILHAANMSLGMNLLFKLVAQVAQKLDDQYDIEITETHHRFKRDAPSGTALELARRIAAAKDWPFDDCLTHGRVGKEKLRKPHTIGMHAIRAGDTVGHHNVIFSALGETVEFSHRAHSRDTFVRGALHAAQWLAGRPAGMYSMADVLSL